MNFTPFFHCSLNSKTTPLCFSCYIFKNIRIVLFNYIRNKEQNIELESQFSLDSDNFPSNFFDQTNLKIKRFIFRIVPGKHLFIHPMARFLYKTYIDPHFLESRILSNYTNKQRILRENQEQTINFSTYDQHSLFFF